MSVNKHRDFLDYWDSRFDENEKVLNSYPQLANFTFRECNKLWDALHTDYAALEVRHNALREAVAWERECRDVDVWMNTRPWSRGDAEIWSSLAAARAEVDRLIENESAADCKGEV